MPLDLLTRRRWPIPLAGSLLFLAAFTSVFCMTLPREAILGWLSPALGKSGVRLEAQDARFLFPAGLEIDNATIQVPGQADTIQVGKVSVRFDPFWLFRGLPIHFKVASGAARIDIRLSSASTTPARGRISVFKLSSADFPGLLPGNGLGLAIDQCEIAWNRSSGGKSAGIGKASLSLMKFSIPAADSPVKEAVIRDAMMDFALKGGALHVSSLRGKYEGAPVEGTGEIDRIASPSRSTITFHLKIPNPYEGNVATIFNLVAKNAKNATLIVSGPLLSPAGEFRFF